MTTHPDDRTDDRTDNDDRTITVTSMDAGGEQTARREPVDENGEPIFPPGSADAGIPEAEMSDHSLQDTRADDADLPGDPAGESARLLPDGSGYTAPVESDADLADDRLADDRLDFRDTSDDANVNVPPGPTTDGTPTIGVAGGLPDTTATTGNATSSTSSEPAHLADADDQAWLALQGRFVDDPAQAVREAGDRVEQQFKDFRSRLESADTEALRTAFKQLRDLSATLR